MAYLKGIPLVFMGTPGFAVPSLDLLYREGYRVEAVVTRPDRPRGRGRKVSFSPVKERARGCGIPVWQPERPGEGLVRQLRELAPGLIVVVAYGMILPGEVLDLPPLGCINLHASLLPRYRGAAPIHRAVMQGEEETGVTTMYMDRGMDTGDIILQAPAPIGPEDTAGTLHDHLASRGAGLLLETLGLVGRGRAPRQPQDPRRATYAPPLHKDEEVIHWGRPAREIYNQVRGMNPWPGAYTWWGGRRLKVWESRACPAGPGGAGGGDPGGIVKVSPGGIWVGTGSGVLQVTLLQAAGGKRLPVKDFIRGNPLQEGDRLGQ